MSPPRHLLSTQDCRDALPVIQAEVKALTRPATVVWVCVGDRETWKSNANPYRASPFGVRGVLTIARWKTGRVDAAMLGDDEAGQPELVRNFFTA